MVEFDSMAESYPNRGPAVFAVTTTTLVLCSIFVVARIYTRLRIVRLFSTDDYLIVVAWLFAFFVSFTIDLGTVRGLGRHDVNIPAEDKPGLRRTEYVFSVLYNPALMATKTSVLCFYLRLFKDTQKVLRGAAWTVLILVNLAGTILTLLNVFQCRPVEASWEDSATQAQCLPLLTEFICSAPINIVSDVAILTLPIPIITSLKLPPRQKTILVITFGLGVFVTIVDVVRVYYLQQAINVSTTGTSSDPTAIFGDNAEFPWNASFSLMWSAVEVNVGIMCACIPTLKPLVIKIVPRMLSHPGWTARGSSTIASKHASTPPKGPSVDGVLSSPPGQGDHRQGSIEVNNHRPRESEEVSMADFLTTPDPTLYPRSQQDEYRPGTALTARTMSSRVENSVYFGFVNIRRPRSMLKTSSADSWRYCAVVTTLFFLWGFSYGLLNTLNNVVAAVADMSQAQTLGLTSIYFGGGYLLGPALCGEWLLRHDEHRRWRQSNSANNEDLGGFKATFIVGLLIYGTGTIMFWPSAVLAAFGGFMVSSFVVGFGLGVLETAANPFLALCGPMAYAEMRLLFAQGVQAVGSVLSLLLAQKVFFKTLSSTDTVTVMILLDVQWSYLAITMFCVLLALFFYYMPLPEVTDKELNRLAQSLPVNPKKRSFAGLELRTCCLIFAVLAQWTYIAAQESMSIFFSQILAALMSTDQATNVGMGGTGGLQLSPQDYILIARTAFAVSRFAAGYISYLSAKHPTWRFVPTPRTILTVSAALNVIFAILVVSLRPYGNANLLVIPIVLFFLAEGPLWPLIFALGLRGQGKRTKRAAAFLTMGASAGGPWPFVIFGIVKQGGSIQTAFVVVIVMLIFTLVYPLFLTFVKDAKTMVEFSIRDDGKGPLNADTNGRRQQSPSSQLNLDEIIQARRRAIKDPTAGEGSAKRALRRLSTSIMGHIGHNQNSGSPNAVAEQHEKQQDHGEKSSEGTQKLGREETHGQDRATPEQMRRIAPWEDQELDTTILEDDDSRQRDG